jgi:hypothetical protein
MGHWPLFMTSDVGQRCHRCMQQNRVRSGFHLVFLLCWLGQLATGQTADAKFTIDERVSFAKTRSCLVMK